MKYRKAWLAVAIASASVGALAGVWVFADHFLKRYPVEPMGSDDPLEQNDVDVDNTESKDSTITDSGNHRKDKIKIKKLKSKIKEQKSDNRFWRTHYSDLFSVNKRLLSRLGKQDNMLQNGAMNKNK